jgi:hypothetical protein
MKVKKLLSLLSDADPDADVVLRVAIVDEHGDILDEAISDEIDGAEEDTCNGVVDFVISGSCAAEDEGDEDEDDEDGDDDGDVDTGAGE